MHQLLSPLKVRQAASAAGLGLHYAVLFLPFAFVIWWLAGGGLEDLAGRPLVALVLAGGIYLGSHCVRALRLAVMASRLLGISARSSALLHMVTAPGAMIIPFKLGEGLRLHQLWYLGRSFPGALIIILLERFFDGLMILVLLGIVYAYHGPLGLGPMLLLAVTSLAVLAGLVVFVLGPGILRAVQQYVVLNHRNPKSLRHLGQLDGLRQITTRGADLFRAQGAVLLVMSLVIWGLEAMAATILAFTYAGFTETSGIVVLAERVFDGSVGALQEGVGAWSSLCLLSLALVWPIAMWIYLPRVKNEPLRAQNRTGVL